MKLETREKMVKYDVIVFADGKASTFYADYIAHFLEECEDKFEDTIGQDASNWTSSYLYPDSEAEQPFYKLMFDKNVLRHNTSYGDHKNKYILGDGYWGFKREFYTLMGWSIDSFKDN
jgi:hypothetical protein